MFSWPRISQIIYRILRFRGISSFGVRDWLTHRLEVLQSMLAGTFSSEELDIPTFMMIDSFKVVWLGLAFENNFQLVYIAEILIFLGLLVWLCWKYRDENFLFMLALSVLVNNILGIICEVNLFYSAEFGIMTSRNIFQIIPVICLLYMTVSVREPN